ncbi:MAG: universal stress protein [Reyranella sp.]|nr:universal stress protein [Reyranella sp.]
MRSILVTVDDTPSSIAAKAVAVALAQGAGASLRGMTGIEISDLEQVEPVPLGGVQYAYDRLQHREQLAKERRVRVARLPEAFQRSLAEQGLEAPCSVIETDVRGNLLREIETCDLVVTGRDTEFHLEPRDGVAPLVEHLIARGGRPVVVSGPTAAGTGPILVAYDGSAPAAKALQMATLLGLFGSSGGDGAAHVLSIHRDRSEASAIALRAGTFLKSHGIEAKLEPCVASGDPADFLMRRAAEIGARMLVMGAFGHRGFREILFGSCTRRLFNGAPLPLFIYH